MNRIEFSAKLLDEYVDYSILDIGCRDKKLQELLLNYNNYQGLDLYEDEDVMQYDLEKKLPFKKNSFDHVVCLDVLEHIENVHQLFNDIINISRKSAIVSFPNMYYYRFRLNYLFGKEISGKYRFSDEPIKDRHRWITSCKNTTNFIKKNINDKTSLQIYRLSPHRNRFKFLSFFEDILIKILPNLFTYTIVFHIEFQG